MTTLREAAQRALEELERGLQFGSVTRAITALRTALSEPETEAETYKRLYELRGKALERPCFHCGYKPRKIYPMEQRTETEQEPVAWGYPDPQSGVIIDSICPEEHAREEGGYTVPLYTQGETALPRLLRIMGTFDLATGHASTMDEALDELESELRDVLGYYRTAKPDDTALLRQALEALEARAVNDYFVEHIYAAITALRDRLGEST